MFNKLKKESGSVTIEATISLSSFMFAIVTILTIVNICVVQAKMSYYTLTAYHWTSFAKPMQHHRLPRPKIPHPVIPELGTYRFRYPIGTTGEIKI